MRVGQETRRAAGRWGALLGAMVLVAAGPGTVAAQEGLRVGDQAPVIRINDLDGKAFDLATVIGRKPVVFEFWATWCALCEELMPRMQAARDRYGDQVEFLGVNVTVNQKRDKVRQYVAKHRPPFRTLYDDQGASARAYRVPTTSYVVIVDAAGVVQYTGSGGDQDIAAALAKVMR